MAKSAEKLLILGEVCKGLLARVYNLTGEHFKRPATLNLDVEKVCKVLVKRFPDHPPDMDKIQMEIFTKRAQEICSELQDYYMTFLGVMNLYETAYKALLDISKSIVTFRMDVNPDLTNQFMDLFVYTIQLHLLSAQAVDSKLMLSAYAKAYHTTHGNTEPNFLRIVKYVEGFANPIQRLREEFAEFTLIVGGTLVNFFMRVSKWPDAASLIQKKIFNVIEDAKDLATDAGFENHIELLHLDKFHLWTLYGFLICPGALSRDNALPLLQACLKDCFVLPIFRDQTLPIHEEFSKVFDSFVFNKFKLSKHKKLLREARDDAIAPVERHRQLRTYLRVELHTLLHFFQEFPGLLCPKLQMVLCAMRLSRNELLWYFRHLGVKPYKPKKSVEEKDYVDPHVSELIYLVENLYSLVKVHKKAIQEYYVHQLTQVDREKLMPVVQNFVQTAKITHGLTELIQEITGSLHHATVQDEFEALRLNWYRVSVQLNSQPQPVRPEAASALNSAMSTIIHHSRAIDRLDRQLEQHGSMMLFYWYRPLIAQILKENLASTNGQAAHCLSLVQIMGHALDNVHSYCPEEQKLIGTQAVKTAESFLANIVSQLEQYLFGITGKISKLRAQIAPVDVVHRVHRQTMNKGQADPLPGYESLYACRSVIKDMYHYEKIVAEIAGAIRRVDTVKVYNTEFAPREFVYEGITKAVREAIRRIALTNEKFIQRPSVMLTQIKDLIYAFSHLDRHVPINLSDIVRDVLFTEFSDISTGGAGDPLVDEAVLSGTEKKEEKSNLVLIHTLSAWYLLELQRAQERIVTYSELKKSFVTLGRTYDTTVLATEYHFDITEMHALCTLAGPNGVRVIDRSLLSIIAQNVGVVKDILKHNDEVLKTLTGRFTERNIWVENVAKLVDLDRLMKHSILIGCTLKFRKMLRQGLQEATAERVPFLHETIRSIFLQYPPNVNMDAKLAPVDYLAQDCGLDLEGADHSLKLVVKKYKSNPQDEALWAHLPELYAAALVAPSWQQCQYLIQTESHQNNLHCVAACIVSLVTAFQSLSGSSVYTNDGPPERRIQSDLDRFLRYACYSILHMTQAKSGEPFSGYPIPSILVFVEQFVKESGCLTLSILEEFLPFTLLRTNYIQMYEKQSIKGRSYAPVADDEKE